ncbi:MAG: HEAT repeat domain-containing protein [Limisphaerales bacterium]
MRKRVQIALAVLLVALAGVIAWQVFHASRERRLLAYQGKRLSVWLDAYREKTEAPHPYVGPDEQAAWNHEIEILEDAIRHIGTNALPVLIERLHAHDTALKKFIMAIADKQKLVHFHFKSAQQRRHEAVLGYSALGPLASAHVPSLSDTLTTDPSPEIRYNAASALGCIGPDARIAAPALFHATKDTNEFVRNNSLWALGRILPDAQLTVPVLVASLDDTNSDARGNAAIALMKYGPEAKAAVPALLRTLATNNAASFALKAIDPEAAAQAGVK